MQEDENYSGRQMTPEEIEEYRKRREFIDEISEWESTYKDLYPDEWVAFHPEERYVAHSNDYEEFFQILERDLGSEKMRSVHVRYFKTNPDDSVLYFQQTDAPEQEGASVA